MNASDAVAHTLVLLLQRCAGGDAGALKILYEKTAPKLFGVALRILHRRDWAEDVLQDCFIAIWHNACRYQPNVSAPMTWMTTIVRNRCLDGLRRPQREVFELDEDFLAQWADDSPGPLAQLLMTDDSRQLAKCMQQLQATQRQAIALAFLDGRSHQETATQLRAPLGTVKTWIRRGLEKLKGCLQ